MGLIIKYYNLLPTLRVLTQINKQLDNFKNINLRDKCILIEKNPSTTVKILGT